MLTWQIADDPIDETEQEAFAGKCQIGNVKRSGSGRWRWEIVSLPGLFRFRDDGRGWEDTEGAAKGKVAENWTKWVAVAALQEKPE